MEDQSFAQMFAEPAEEKTCEFELVDGSRVAVIGGGPSGSFFTYFLLDLAERMGLDIEVDIYEPRDFNRPGPPGCNMCGGIISESLVQHLAAEGINLPPTVVQRGIESYTLHMDVGDARIETPVNEKRIGAVFRGVGPRDIKESKWGSLDGHLQSLAISRGAKVIQERVRKVTLDNGRPQIKVRRGVPQTYDLIAVTVGVNSAALKLFEGLELDYQPPVTTKTFIREYYLGAEKIADVLGNSMHVFLLDIPNLEFAAIVPKGDYATICMLGEDINKELFQAFLTSEEVTNVMPTDWVVDEFSCQCSPRMNVGAADEPYADRIVFVGDCGVARLYKDGIGAAYRTAKAAATTAVFQGISAEHFQKHYLPACKAIETDNTIGKVVFMVADLIKKTRFARSALLRMVRSEQTKEGHLRRMSMVQWDLYTGSSSYKDIFLRTLHPAFLVRFGWDNIASLFGQITGVFSRRPAQNTRDRQAIEQET